ncbi:uncharacterized protein [Aphelocoma coerulescens]|uniref:uncharacterized protein n=1 Tax=Aphelocoma coerulescens TaxID=39617 RepID=UPI0036053F11
MPLQSCSSRMVLGSSSQWSLHWDSQGPGAPGWGREPLRGQRQDLGVLKAMEHINKTLGPALAEKVTGPYWCTLVHPGGCFPTMVSVQDPFDQDDRDGWKRFLTQVDIQVVDNDLTATNPKLIARAAELRARNCLLLKVNQIRLVTKSIRAFKLAQSYSWGVMVSHRLGETEDTFISDLVVGLCAGQIQMGAPCCSKRFAKNNQLMKRGVSTSVCPSPVPKSVCIPPCPHMSPGVPAASMSPHPPQRAGGVPKPIPMSLPGVSLSL